jgi:CRP/FNR family transcriptional regulator, cyclic AMP receptor protein
MGSTRPEYARIRLAFGASAYFRELPAASLDALAEVSTLERCARGGLLATPGLPAEKLWLVIDGGLLVLWANAHGEAIPVAMIGPGSFYSAASLVEGSVQPAECRAERDTVIAALTGRHVRELAARDTALGALVPKLILQRVKAVISLYADSVSSPLRERLAQRLLSQAMASRLGADGREIELRTSQTDLARMLGASRSKLNLELRKLEQDEVLRLGYRRIYLRDRDGLCRIAGSRVLFF